MGLRLKGSARVPKRDLWGLGFLGLGLLGFNLGSLFSLPFKGFYRGFRGSCKGIYTDF